MEIVKYSATGNTFIIADIRSQVFPLERVSLLCNQHHCDGVILLSEHPDADFKMAYYNADGSVGEMCGNGGRAITHFAWGLQIKPGQKDYYRFATTNSYYQAQLLGDQEVRLRMSELYDEDLYDLSSFGFSRSFYLNTGVPHAVFEVSEVDGFDVYGQGKEIAHDILFPQGTNVNFFQILEPRLVRIRTFERGVEDETLSCGTGATATAIALSKALQWQQFVELEAPGGRLRIEFDRDYKEIFLCGKVEKIFSKQLDLG